MRGKLLRPLVRGIAVRIIPAHAGQTGRRRSTGRSSPDHPRACGANQIQHGACSARHGSSPRMRGKLMKRGSLKRSRRIIPAHAGQTHRVRGGVVEFADHPRACGANMPWSIRNAARVGSSPRMRGKRRARGRPRHHTRIIPAHAGQTRVVFDCAMVGPDHPRACGANADSLFDASAVCGSSPRMRGKRLCGSLTPGLVRIIPAHAGQTKSGVRSCRPMRIIPAHAGQTIPRCAPSTPGPDHPRACGANQRYDNGGSFEHGSSPRMRGKRRNRRQSDHADRIIPAHAGQT